jgi:hypothetical protein
MLTKSCSLVMDLTSLFKVLDAFSWSGLIQTVLGNGLPSSQGDLSHLKLVTDIFKINLGLLGLKCSHFGLFREGFGGGMLPARMENKNKYFAAWCNCLNPLSKRNYFV